MEKRTLEQLQSLINQALATPEPQSETSGGGSVLVIGDTHAPFTHKNYLDHCQRVRDRFQCELVVHIGDEVDNHALSYHEHDPDGQSAGDEAVRAMEELRKWYKAFPDVNVMIGNHGALPFRKAMTHGLPKRFLKAYEDVWEAPEGWKWMTEWEHDGVLYTHGTGSSGQNGAINRAVQSRQSVVIGHLHSFGGVQYHANGTDTIFGMNAGCGIDVNAYAMAYGKAWARKPTLGCGVVLDKGKTGLFIPMDG